MFNMLSKEQGVEVCDARKDDGRAIAGNRIIEGTFYKMVYTKTSDLLSGRGLL